MDNKILDPGFNEPVLKPCQNCDGNLTIKDYLNSNGKILYQLECTNCFPPIVLANGMQSRVLLIEIWNEWNEWSKLNGWDEMQDAEKTELLIEKWNRRHDDKSI